jgi:hypothetical protein
VQVVDVPDCGSLFIITAAKQRSPNNKEHSVSAGCFASLFFTSAGPPFGSRVQFLDVPNFSSLFIVTAMNHSSSRVWLFKGLRLAIAVKIDDILPAIGETLSQVTLNETIAAGSSIVRTVQRVMKAADSLFGALPPPYPVRDKHAWANDTLLDTRVLWEVSYDNDIPHFYYNAHAGSAGWTARDLQVYLVQVCWRGGSTGSQHMKPQP